MSGEVPPSASRSEPVRPIDVDLTKDRKKSSAPSPMVPNLAADNSAAVSAARVLPLTPRSTSNRLVQYPALLGYSHRYCLSTYHPFPLLLCMEENHYQVYSASCCFNMDPLRDLRHEKLPVQHSSRLFPWGSLPTSLTLHWLCLNRATYVMVPFILEKHPQPPRPSNLLVPGSPEHNRR